MPVWRRAGMPLRVPPAKGVRWCGVYPSEEGVMAMSREVARSTLLLALVGSCLVWGCSDTAAGPEIAAEETAPEVARISIEPASVVLSPGTVYRFRVRAFDQDGQEIERGFSMRMTSSNPSVVTILPSGRVGALELGSAVVTVSCGVYCARATVKVMERKY